MLVLSRREGERLLIGGNIWITILRADTGKVRIGIDAPAEVAVQREEVIGKPVAHEKSRPESLPTGLAAAQN